MCTAELPWFANVECRIPPREERRRRERSVTLLAAEELLGRQAEANERLCELVERLFRTEL